jgi:hypothetical protein
MGGDCDHVFTTDYADDADKSQTDLKEFSDWTCKNQESRTQEWNLHFLGYLLFISWPKNSTANQTDGNEGNEESIDVESGNQEPRKFPNGGAPSYEFVQRNGDVWKLAQDPPAQRIRESGSELFKPLRALLVAG